jgi:hypothetical protein
MWPRKKFMPEKYLFCGWPFPVSLFTLPVNVLQAVCIRCVFSSVHRILLRFCYSKSVNQAFLNRPRFSVTSTCQVATSASMCSHFWAPSDVLKLTGNYVCGIHIREVLQRFLKRQWFVLQVCVPRFLNTNLCLFFTFTYTAKQKGITETSGYGLEGQSFVFRHRQALGHIQFPNRWGPFPGT